MRKETVSISGVWLRRIGDKVQVLVEASGIIDGKWFHDPKWLLVIEEQADGAFSHIAETEGILQSPIDADALEESQP